MDSLTFVYEYFSENILVIIIIILSGFTFVGFTDRCPFTYDFNIVNMLPYGESLFFLVSCLCVLFVPI